MHQESDHRSNIETLRGGVVHRYASTKQAPEDKDKTGKWENEKKIIPPDPAEPPSPAPPLPSFEEERSGDDVSDEDKDKTGEWEEGKGG